jgi:hypothetical protein
MYCQSCGNALPQKMKYCNRCGALLITTESVTVKKSKEKRLDTYLDGLFWITVFGLAFIFGGMLILEKAGFADWILITYIVVSSTLFLFNFGINLWGTLRLMKGEKELPGSVPPLTTELDSAPAVNALGPAPPRVSVTENTTRTLEPHSASRQ